MFLEAKRREVHTSAEDLRFCQDTNSADTIKVHLHIWVAKRVTQICKMRAPCSILGIPFHNYSVLVKGVGKSESCLGLLPGIEIIGLLTAEPVWKGSPNVFNVWSANEEVESEHSLLGTITSLLWRIKSSRIVVGAVSTSTSLQ